MKLLKLIPVPRRGIGRRRRILIRKRKIRVLMVKRLLVLIFVFGTRFPFGCRILSTLMVRPILLLLFIFLPMINSSRRRSPVRVMILRLRLRWWTPLFLIVRRCLKIELPQRVLIMTCCRARLKNSIRLVTVLVLLRVIDRLNRQKIMVKRNNGDWSTGSSSFQKCREIEG